MVSFGGFRNADFVGRYLSSYKLVSLVKSIHALICERTVLNVGGVGSQPDTAILGRRGAQAGAVAQPSPSDPSCPWRKPQAGPIHPWRAKPVSLATDDEVSKLTKDCLAQERVRLARLE